MMRDSIQKIREHYQLEIDAPFSLLVGNETYSFQALIKGYGAKLGTVIDEDWQKIQPISRELISMGYAYSCFDIYDSCTDDFQDILNDWGVYK